MSEPAMRDRASSVGPRVRGVWRELYAEQQLAALAAIGLVGSMFLPWYQETVVASSRGGNLQSVENSLIAFESWGFVEASILLVTLGVLALLFSRAERRAFHLPFGDGAVVMAAGAWTMFLVFYRQVDKPDGSESGALKTTIGVNWGIFVAFLLGALLTYAGWRMAQRHRPEPVADGDDPRTRRAEGDPASVASPPDPRDAPTTAIPQPERPTRPLGPAAASTSRGRRRQGDRVSEGQFEGQMSFDDPDAPDAA